MLKSIEIFISAEGLSEVKVAWKENISSSIDKYLELETTETDVKEFIKKDEFNLIVSAVKDEALASDHHLAVHSVFFVGAKVFGQ